MSRGRYATIDALIIVRHGYLVHEQYGLAANPDARLTPP